MRRIFTSLGFLFLFTLVSVQAQTFKVFGKITDKSNRNTVPGAIVTLVSTSDSTERFNVLTNASGEFLALVNPKEYKLKVSILGFQDHVQKINVQNRSTDVGSIQLTKKFQELNEVVVEGQATPVAQKGDTTEMSASAYKVNPDADAQDLIQKMPGVTIENGTVKAHGEEIKRVLVDGKNYFGEDPSMALQNLPAEVIDKVQIYNKMSDQSEFTGFDDGNSSKVINIITRADRRNGTNGQFTAGSDFSDKYLANGRLNVSNGQRRLTVTGNSNNVNQQGFSTQDMLGVMGGSSSGGGGGSRRSGGGGSSSGFIGRQGGLNKNHAIGLNYTDYITPNLTLTGSYFFNMQDNYTLQTTNTQYVGSIDTTKQARYQKQLSSSNSSNYNHRFDFKLEYQIDSLNSLIWSPRFSTQQNNRDAFGNSIKFTSLSDTMLNSRSKSGTDGLGYNYNSDLTFRHRFSKKGRTISLGVANSGSLRNSDGTSWSNSQSLTTVILKDQKNNSKTNGNSISGNLAYTEPIGLNSILQLSYNKTINDNHTDRYVYDQTVSPAVRDDSLSNVYKNGYNTDRYGLTYRLRELGGALMFSAGGEYQVANLTGDRVFPKIAKVDKTFENFLPNAMLTYKVTKNTNIRAQYRTSTNPPSVTQLQDVVDVTNSTSFSKGNPNLKHEYSHTGMLNFRLSNPDKFTNFSFNLYGTYTQNNIGNATIIMTKDTVIQGQTLLRNGQLVMPVNLSDSWSSRMFMNYGFLFVPIKCNLTLLGGLGYSTTPGYVNKILSETNSYSLTGGLVVASNISQNIDFTASYNVNYNISRNNIQSSVNSNAWYHSISLKSNFITWQNFVIQNSLMEQINRGLAGGYNQDYLQWNAGLGKKFLANNALELKFTVYDILNQNKNISHTVSEISIADSRTNTLGRYYLFSIMYTLRQYKSGGDGERHRDGGGFGRGGFGGPGMGGRD